MMAQSPRRRPPGPPPKSEPKATIRERQYVINADKCTHPNFGSSTGEYNSVRITPPGCVQEFPIHPSRRPLIHWRYVRVHTAHLPRKILCPSPARALPMSLYRPCRCRSPKTWRIRIRRPRMVGRPSGTRGVAKRHCRDSRFWSILSECADNDAFGGTGAFAVSPPGGSVALRADTSVAKSAAAQTATTLVEEARIGFARPFRTLRVELFPSMDHRSERRRRFGHLKLKLSASWPVRKACTYI